MTGIQKKIRKDQTDGCTNVKRRNFTYRAKKDKLNFLRKIFVTSTYDSDSSR